METKDSSLRKGSVDKFRLRHNTSCNPSKPAKKKLRQLYDALASTRRFSLIECMTCNTPIALYDQVRMLRDAFASVSECLNDPSNTAEQCRAQIKCGDIRDVVYDWLLITGCDRDEYTEYRSLRDRCMQLRVEFPDETNYPPCSRVTKVDLFRTIKSFLIDRHSTTAADWWNAMFDNNTHDQLQASLVEIVEALDIVGKAVKPAAGSAECHDILERHASSLSIISNAIHSLVDPSTCFGSSYSPLKMNAGAQSSGSYSVFRPSQAYSPRTNVTFTDGHTASIPSQADTTVTNADGYSEFHASRVRPPASTSDPELSPVRPFPFTAMGKDVNTSPRRSRTSPAPPVWT